MFSAVLYETSNRMLKLSNVPATYSMNMFKSRKLNNCKCKLSFSYDLLRISCHWSLSIAPENMRKPEVFGGFQEV